MSEFEDKLFFKIPLEKLTLTKELALIFKKYQLGQMLDYIGTDNNDVTFSFSKINKNFISDTFFLNNFTTKIYFYSRDPNEYLNFSLETKTIEKEFNYDDIKRVNPYLNFINDSPPLLKLIVKGNKKLQNNNLGKEIEQLITNISNFENYRDSIFDLLAISLFCDDNQYRKISISSINNLLRLHDNDILEVPKKESIQRVIELLKFYKSTKNEERFMCGPVAVFKNPRQKRDKISITFSNILFLSELSFDKFNHIFHPGLNLIVNYLEKTNKLEKFELACHKVIYKNI